MENIPNIPRRTRGDRITAEDHNNLAKAISNISRRIPPGGKDYRPVFNEYHPFEFYNVRKSGGAWDVRIEPGFVIETNIQLSTVTKTWTPEIGAVHHVPPSPGNSGTNGVYKIKIATCTITNSVMFIEDVELRDNFYWPNQLIELENVGSEAEIVKAFDATNNKHPHRTLKGDGTDPGSGSDIHDLYLTATQNADTIAFSGKVEIAGSGTSSSHPWKVTSNGDDTVSVARGFLMAWETSNGSGITQDAYRLIKQFTHSVGNVTVTTSGVIYGELDSTTGQLLSTNTLDTEGDLVTKTQIPSGTLSIVNGTTVPNTGTGKMRFLIAKVTLAGMVATVDDQYLTHNPDLTLVMQDIN